MYEGYFKLSGKPFQLSPNPRFYFGSRGHQRALAYLQYGLNQGEGFIVITGDIGTGKTTLIGYLLGQLDASKYVTAKLVTTQLEADDMLRMVAADFGVDPGRDKSTMLVNFERFLLDTQRRGRRALVLVDEAQNLPMRSLEELRMLSNLQTSDVAPVQFFLIGQPQFRGILASDNLEQLRQRVIANYHLGPLNADETRSYIEHRLGLVGWQSDPGITTEAHTRIHERAGGVPRQVNLLCDRLLLGAMLDEMHEIDAGFVDAVAAEMSAEGTPGRVDVEPTPRQRQRTPRRRQTQSETLSDISQRLTSLEELVQSQYKKMRRAMEVVAAYLDGSAAAQMPPREGDGDEAE
jgi:general secretion pathway protein A